MNVVNNITKLEFEEIQKKRIPTLIKNGLKDFPRIKEWNKDYILKKYGKSMCNYSYDSRPVRSKSICSISEYFNNYPDSYSFTRKKFNPLETNVFTDDITFPNNLFYKKDIDKSIFYCGPSHTGALPHSHGAALNFMVYGKKKWIMFDTKTELARKVQQYYYEKYPSAIWMEWFKAEYKNLKENIPILECIQEDNDIMFVPDGYNHTVFNMKPTMGVVVEINPFQYM